jgi:hypothetical protein
METSDIQSILELLSGSPFSRTISTYATHGKQIQITSPQEAFDFFKNLDL